jgi:hypothetical protein
VFAPFHYGHWDPDDLTPEPDADHRTANELTMTVWDPVSKQPSFKTAACRVTRLRAGDGPAPAPTNTASAPVSGGDAVEAGVLATGGGAPTSSHVLTEAPHYALDPSHLDPGQEDH